MPRREHCEVVEHSATQVFPPKRGNSENSKENRTLWSCASLRMRNSLATVDAILQISPRGHNSRPQLYNFSGGPKALAIKTARPSDGESSGLTTCSVNEQPSQ